MLRVLTQIVFTQQPSTAWPKRNKTLIYPLCHSFEINSSWQNLTDTCKIIIPKNVRITDNTNDVIDVKNTGSYSNAGGFASQTPLFLKGDKVTISAGYRYYNDAGVEVSPMNKVFEGYVVKVNSGIPIEIHCEDNMFRLKQIIAKNKVYPAKQYSLEGILQDLLAGSGFTVNVLTNTSFGDFSTQNETVAEVLARLKKDYKFYSYFRGSELRCGSIVYLEQDAINDGLKTFQFQKNIISDELEYKRLDDIDLSAIAYSINKNSFKETTKDGSTKTKKQRLEILVTERNGNFVRTPRPLGTRADFAPNTSGERRTLYFWNVTDINILGNLAQQELKKYYYNGLHGKFTVFGLPYVRHGDNVQLIDNKLPERNGVYKIKAAEYTGGVKGLRQHLSIDYKIS